MKLIKQLFNKYRELIMYGIFGVLATLINTVAYYLFADLLHIWYIAADIGAWILAFLFAFVTNKLFVFESKEWKGQKALREMLEFFIARASTGVLDVVLMWLFVDILQLNGLFSKIVVNVLVILINYFASKFWIFKKTKKGNEKE